MNLYTSHTVSVVFLCLRWEFVDFVVRATGHPSKIGIVKQT
jgi:hypothetical protein